MPQTALAEPEYQGLIQSSNQLAIAQVGPPLAIDGGHAALINQHLQTGDEVRVVTSDRQHLIQARRVNWLRTTATTTSTVYTNIGTWATPTTSSWHWFGVGGGGRGGTGSTLINTPATTNLIYYSTGYTDADTTWVTVWSDDFEPQRLKNQAPMLRRKLDMAKASIKRAMKLIDNFGMTEDVKIFLGGNRIEVSHPDSLFKFVLHKPHYHGLIDRTQYPGASTPYKLELYTKTDVHVADLCVYMEQTPILDQVLALSMFVKTGNEEEILRQANYTSKIKDQEFMERLMLMAPVLKKKLRLSY